MVHLITFSVNDLHEMSNVSCSKKMWICNKYYAILILKLYLCIYMYLLHLKMHMVSTILNYEFITFEMLDKSINCNHCIKI